MAIRVAGKEFRRQVFGPAAPTGDNPMFAPADNFRRCRIFQNSKFDLATRIFGPPEPIK
jgi:hypothetical protein